MREILGGTVDERGKGNAQMKGPGGSEPKDIRDSEAVAELLPSLTYLTQALEQEIKDGKIEIHLEPRGLVVSLRQATFFPSGEDALDPATFASIEKIADDHQNAAQLRPAGGPHRRRPHPHGPVPRATGSCPPPAASPCSSCSTTATTSPGSAWPSPATPTPCRWIPTIPRKAAPITAAWTSSFSISRCLCRTAGSPAERRRTGAATSRKEK